MDKTEAFAAAVICPGDRIAIDGVEVIVTGVTYAPVKITTRPVTDAD